MPDAIHLQKFLLLPFKFHASLCFHPQKKKEEQELNKKLETQSLSCCTQVPVRLILRGLVTREGMQTENDCLMLLILSTGSIQKSFGHFFFKGASEFTTDQLTARLKVPDRGVSDRRLLIFVSLKQLRSAAKCSLTGCKLDTQSKGKKVRRRRDDTTRRSIRCTSCWWHQEKHRWWVEALRAASEFHDLLFSLLLLSSLFPDC